jgi:hypothetical protein
MKESIMENRLALFARIRSNYLAYHKYHGWLEFENSSPEKVAQLMDEAEYPIDWTWPGLDAGERKKLLAKAGRPEHFSEVWFNAVTLEWIQKP